MENEQSLKQKKIVLAQSEHAGVIVELMRDCMPKTPIVADTEWQTIVNAITLDVTSTMMRNVVDYIDRIRKGELHDQ
jgi:hypothetical protein